MKIFVALCAVMAVALAEEEKAAPAAAQVLLPANTLPLTYNVAPIAAANTIAYSAPVAAAPALTYTAANTVVAAAPAPAVTYAAAAPAPAVTYTAAAPVAASTVVAAAPAPAVTYTAAAPAPAVTYTAAAPVAANTIVAAAPAPAVTYTAAAAPAVPYVAGSQFHAQDELGNLNYGYSNLNSAKQEVGNTYAGVNGAYSYVDAEGKLQQVTYTADALGFRTQDSRLPVAPTFNPEPLVAPVFEGVAPEPVMDTPEVAEARAAHLAAVEAAGVEVVERRRREADPAVLAGYSRVLTAPTPLIHNAPVVTYSGLGYAAGLPYAGLGYAGLGYAGLPLVY